MRNNDLTALQNKLFEAMEWLQDRDITGDDLDQEIKRNLAFNEIAKTAVTNGALMLKCADSISGLPVSGELPLIPLSPSKTPVIVSGDRKSLLAIPKKGENE